MSAGTATPRGGRALLREPVLHFFVAGAAVFAVYRALNGAPRTVVVTRAVKTELARRFQDTNGRAPNPDELNADVHKWELDEALSREAARERLDRDEPAIRSILADKMRIRAAFEVPKREPTLDELDAWLATHRQQYETPARYDFELVAFPKSEAGASAKRDDFARAVAAGSKPESLGRSVIGGNLTADDLKDRFEQEVAQQIPRLSPGGAWQSLETPQNLVLARLKKVGGGVPTRQELGERLIADWKAATKQQEVDRILQRTIDRYRFEVEP